MSHLSLLDIVVDHFGCCVGSCGKLWALLPREGSSDMFMVAFVMMANHECPRRRKLAVRNKIFREAKHEFLVT
jgi:hypothetical protein